MDYFTDIEDIALKNNIGITDTEFDSVDGMCIGGQKGYLIIVDTRLSPYHRRWTIAHELGHIADDTVGAGHSRIAESRADALGIDMLISDSDLCRALDDYGCECEFLGSLFGVPHEILERKCKKLL